MYKAQLQEKGQGNQEIHSVEELQQNLEKLATSSPS